jgi:hypothetical protein
MRFTDNPLEQLMREKPGFHRDKRPERCRDCERWNGKKCRKCTRKDKGSGTSGQLVPKFV